MDVLKIQHIVFSDFHLSCILRDIGLNLQKVLKDIVLVSITLVNLILNP